MLITLALSRRRHLDIPAPVAGGSHSFFDVPTTQFVPVFRHHKRVSGHCLGSAMTAHLNRSARSMQAARAVRSAPNRLHGPKASLRALPGATAARLTPNTSSNLS